MHKRLYTFFFLVVCTYIVSYAQISDIIPSGTTIANTPVARVDRWNAFSNPASLAQEGFAVGIQYENKYLLAELSGKSVQASYCNPWINVGIAFMHFGYKQYSDIMAGVCLSHNFNDRFSIGVQCNYYAAYFGDETGYKGTVFPQIGINIFVCKGLNIGFQAFNPFLQNIKGELVEKKVPAVFSIGTSYAFLEKFTWDVQIDKEVRSPFRVATGLEYQIVEQFGVKIGGYANRSFTPCLGVKLCFRGVRFDLHCEWDPVLGVNTLGNISYAFNK